VRENPPYAEATADFSATYVRLGRQQLGQDVSCRRVKLGLEP